MPQKAVLRGEEEYSDKCILLENRSQGKKSTKFVPQGNKSRRTNRARVSRRNKVTKIWKEINEIEVEKATESIYEALVKKKQGVGLFSNVRKKDSNKIINEKRRHYSWSREIHVDVRDYCEYVYAEKLDNLKEMDKALKTYNPPRLNQNEKRTWIGQ